MRPHTIQLTTRTVIPQVLSRRFRSDIYQDLSDCTDCIWMKRYLSQADRIRYSTILLRELASVSITRSSTETRFIDLNLLIVNRTYSRAQNKFFERIIILLLILWTDNSLGTKYRGKFPSVNEYKSSMQKLY